MFDHVDQERSGASARSARLNGSSTNATSAYPSRLTQMASSGIATTATSPVVRGPLSEGQIEWLETRGITAETAAAYGLEAAAVRGGGSWIAFPFILNGTAVNRKYRRIDRKAFSQDPGGKQCWWNGDAIANPAFEAQQLIITEGEMDALSAIEAGYQRVVSVPGGAPSTAGGEGNGKYAFLADTLPQLDKVREIVLAVDGDEPGRNLLHDLSIRLGPGRCRYVVYPAGCKDLNDVWQQHGVEGVTQAVTGAKWCHAPGLFLMSELPPVPYAKPHNTMIAGLHEHYNLRKADFCVVTGVPGSGKSTFVNDLACRMAFHHGWRTCFASFEQFPQVDHRRALRTWHSRKLEMDMTPAELAAADEWIDRWFSFLIPLEDQDADLEWILDGLAAAVVRYGADICVIDPWNELDHVRQPGKSLTEYVGEAIRRIKKFARRWNVHMIVVAHPAKMTRDKNGQWPVPGLYDISDSAHWNNKPDVGIVVHPTATDELGPHTSLIVAKSRYHDAIGKPGAVPLRFDRQTSRFVWP